ncbi:MAG TPA: type II secretion system secretin GspD [Stellaceae bacterium]|nr:type II secretion system secretin GspD [Stellaceae bacterium]
MALLAVLPACHSAPPESLVPLPEPTRLQAAPPRVDAAIAGERQRMTAFEARGVDRVPSTPRPLPPLPPRAEQGGAVTLNFVDTDIREVARAVLGGTLKLDYTIDPRVHGTATLATATPLPRDQVLPALETVLNQNGATLVRKNGLYQVIPIGAAEATNTASAASAGGAGTQVVGLRYAGAANLAKVLQPYVGEGGKLTADPAHNALVVSGSSTARQAIVALIRAFDIDALAGRSFGLFPVEDGSAPTTAAALEKAMRAENGGANGGLVTVVPLPRVNAVLVASSQPRYLDVARRFFSLTGRMQDATARTWHVYYVQNGQSADLANLLQRAFTPGHVTAPAVPAAPPGRTAPSLQPAMLNGGAAGLAGAAPGIGERGGLSGLGATALPGAAAGGVAAPPAAAVAALPATEPLSASTEAGEEAMNRMRIIANPRNNALLIYATQREYSVVEGMLRKIDIVPLQVLIDATIAEVTLNDALQYGTQFFFKLDHVSETLGAAPISFPPTPLAPTGLIGFAISKAPKFILQALADVTKVKVLSAPQVLVMDNEPARLQVGQQVPILTATAVSTLNTGAPVVNSVDYHSTGVIMQVTPRINSGGLVTLDVAQEVSAVAPAAANTVIGSPTFDDRFVNTRIAVQDGQTVALAGLIRDNSTDDNNGIPFIKDIPVLSTLFSSQSSTRQRTELLVLITPHVINDQRSARALTEDLRNQLQNAALVRPELEHRPIPGSANPNRL